MTTEPMTTGQTFGERHFGRAQLGDQRRTRRLVALADQLASHPGGTLPHKVKSPKDLKALYRLCECPAVTHEAVLAPHREHTRSLIEQPQGTLRVIHDATELDYTMAKSLSSLGQIGNGHGRGYLCQNSLVVDPKTRQALGLINQVLQGRVQAPKNEAREQRRQGESRESRLWIRGTEGLPAEARLVDVCDRGADTSANNPCWANARSISNPRPLGRDGEPPWPTRPPPCTSCPPKIPAVSMAINRWRCGACEFGRPIRRAK